MTRARVPWTRRGPAAPGVARAARVGCVAEAPITARALPRFLCAIHATKARRRGHPQEAKRYRSAIDELAEEFVCPISTELPVDPVTAADGRVYERSAIEGWIQSRQGQPLKSPVTNEPMGTKLLAAVQVRNSIKAMVKTGAISGAKADAWKQRMADEERVEELRRKVEAGDATAMVSLAEHHRKGTAGLLKDDKMYFKLIKQASDKDQLSGMVHCAFGYLYGKGVNENKARGLVLLGRAIEKGSEDACYLLAHAHARGLHGLDKDPVEASRWYRKGSSQRVQDGADSRRERAASWLRDHP